MKKVWIDTDGENDDIMSLVLFMLDPNVEIIGMSATGASATYMEPNLRWITGIKKQFKQNFVVVEGKYKPYSYSNRYPYRATHFVNQNFGLKYPKLNDKDYIPNERFIDELKNNKDIFDLFLFGGCSNWVEIIEKYPKIKNKIKNVYVYGGVINKDQDPEIGLPGNIKKAFDNKSPYDNDVAEWNAFIDSKALDKILEFFKEKIILFPLNLSNDWNFDKKFVQKIDLLQTPGAKIWSIVLKFMIEQKILKYMSIWDQLCALYYIGDVSFRKKFEVLQNDISVVTEFRVKNDQNGKIILNPNNNRKNYWVRKNENSIDDIYENILNRLK